MSPKVLFAVPSYAPAVSWGGPVESTHRLCQALIELGAHVRVLTTDATTAGDTLPHPSNRWLLHEGVPVLYGRRYLSRTFSPAFLRHLVPEVRRADLVHIGSVFNSTIPATMAAAVACRTPFVLTPRGSLDPWSLAEKSWKKRPALAVLKPMLRRAAAFHATSAEEQAGIEQLGLGAETFVIPNGVDLAQTDGVERRAGIWRRRLEIADGVPMLLILGRLHAKKGIGLGVEVLARLRDASPSRDGANAVLVLAGPDSDGHSSELRAQAESLGVGHRLRSVGRVVGGEKYQAPGGGRRVVAAVGAGELRQRGGRGPVGRHGGGGQPGDTLAGVGGERPRPLGRAHRRALRGRSTRDPERRRPRAARGAPPADRGAVHLAFDRTASAQRLRENPPSLRREGQWNDMPERTTDPRDSERATDGYGWSDAEASCAHAYIRPRVLEILKRLGARKVLDLGCGNGALSRVLMESGFDVTGCDADEEGIEIAREAAGDEAGRFQRVSVYDDPAALGARGFDAVLSVEVVEHLFAPRALPRFARAVLEPGGHFIVTTPYHGYLKNLALSIFGRWDRHLDPLWDGGHVKLWSRATLSRLLEDEGFRVVDFHGAGRWPLLWKSMILVARKEPRDPLR